MSAATMTLEEYTLRYDGKSGYEYWFGEVVRKPMVSLTHGALALILGQLFEEAGYFSACEVDLRVDPNWVPRPDVMGILHPDLSLPYPAKPVDIVAEVLSPSDAMSMVFEKCRNYDRIAIAQILVFDPDGQVAWQWSRETKNLERIDSLRLNSKVIAVTEIWAKLDRRTKPNEKPGNQ